MKKTFYKITIVFLTIVSFIFYSCEDDISNLNISTITEGAVLTTVKVSGTTLNKFNPAQSNLAVTVLFNDFKDNNSMESVELFVRFIDATPDEMGNTISRPEEKIGTLTLNDFQVGSSDFPENEFILNGQVALEALSLAPDEIDGDDIILLRYELKLQDGQIFSSDNVGTNVVTQSHSAPFRYATNIVCLKVPESGDWVLDMKDSFGDGWDGAKITVVIDGVSTDYTVNGGSSEIATINIPSGTQTFTFTYVPARFEPEHSYILTDPNGVKVLDEGPSPTAGELLNKCN